MSRRRLTVNWWRHRTARFVVGIAGIGTAAVLATLAVVGCFTGQRMAREQPVRYSDPSLP